MKLSHHLVRFSALAFGLLAACKSPSGFTEISVNSLHERLAQSPDILLLDVRTPGEWESVRVPGIKKFIPHDQMGERSAELNAQPDTPIYVICRSGHRSAIAAGTLAKLGFKQVFSVQGGTNAWVTAGYPTESGPVPQ